MKKKTSFSLSEECLDKLRDLSRQYGISMASMIELLVLNSKVSVTTDVTISEINKYK